MQDDPKFEGADHIKEHVDSWRSLSPSKMKLKRLGGLSNELWKVTSLDKNIQPRTVIYRKFGSGAAICDRKRENYVLRGLAKEKIAPKFYGGTEKYRVEKYIDAEELCPSDLADEKIRKRIAHLLGDLHNMDFQKLEKKGLVEKILDQDCDYIKKFKEKTEEDCFLPVEKNLIKEIKTLVTKEELSFLKESLPKNQESIVFSHNDLHSQNFMVIKENEKMVLIDYEYSDYNYRGIDIANLFTETMFEYDTAEHPHYSVNEANFPNDEVLRDFIEYYLFFRKFGDQEIDVEYIFAKEANRDEYIKERYDMEKFDKEVSEILNEVKIARLYSHYFWSLWGVLMSHKGDVEFDYVHYAYKRYELYQKIKKEVMESDYSKSDSQDTSANP